MRTSFVRYVSPTPRHTSFRKERAVVGAARGRSASAIPDLELIYPGVSDLNRETPVWQQHARPQRRRRAPALRGLRTGPAMTKSLDLVLGRLGLAAGELQGATRISSRDPLSSWREASVSGGRGARPSGWRPGVGPERVGRRAERHGRSGAARGSGRAPEAGRSRLPPRTAPSCPAHP